VSHRITESQNSRGWKGPLWVKSSQFVSKAADEFLWGEINLVNWQAMTYSNVQAQESMALSKLTGS